MGFFWLARYRIIYAGIIFGVIATLAVNLGNPPNMGLCIAGFMSDITGALNLHQVSFMKYIRPEIMGFMLGSFITAWVCKEWRPRGDSAPVIMFILGSFVMVGSLVFIGCPIRMLLRLAGGDLNGLPALAGLLSGIMFGVQFLKGGFHVGRSKETHPVAAWVLPIMMLGLLLFAVVKPDFIVYSQSGPGSMHVPLAVGLGFGMLVGFMAQRTRMCFMGAWRDLFLVRNTYLLSGILAFTAAALITNYIAGNFSGMYHWGFTGEPLAHTDYIWNFLSMGLVGLATVQIGSCPLRSLVLSGEGDTGAAAVVLGLFAGAGIANNLLITSTPEGVTRWGIAAVTVGWVFCITIGFLMRSR